MEFLLIIAFVIWLVIFMRAVRAMQDHKIKMMLDDIKEKGEIEEIKILDKNEPHKLHKWVWYENDGYICSVCKFKAGSYTSEHGDYNQ